MTSFGSKNGHWEKITQIPQSSPRMVKSSPSTLPGHEIMIPCMFAYWCLVLVKNFGHGFLKKIAVYFPEKGAGGGGGVKGRLEFFSSSKIHPNLKIRSSLNVNGMYLNVVFTKALLNKHGIGQLAPSVIHHLHNKRLA